MSSLLHFLSRLSVSSMDLSQPSVATRKEYWEGQAKSREPCRNCQVASVPFSLRTKHWMTFFRSRCQQRWTFPATGENGNERLWWASFVPNWHPVLLHSMKWQGFVDLSEQQVRDFMDLTKNEEAFLASRPDSPPLRKGPNPSGFR